MLNVLEPMVANQVHTTTDYFLFKPIEGNRKKNLLHINRLKKSMSENYLFTVLIVNENYEIIDGQHRFEVIKELKLPLNYIVCNGYRLKEVHIFNQNSSNWKSEDYLNGYCDLGYPDYITFKKYMSKYGFTLQPALTIFNNLSSTASTEHIKDFQSGNFKIKNLSIAEDFGNKIHIINTLYPGAKRQQFIYSMLKLTKNPKFEFTEFINKLKSQQSSMIDCTSVEQYISLIEEIYNYRRKEKVNLRY